MAGGDGDDGRRATNSDGDERRGLAEAEAKTTGPVGVERCGEGAMRAMDGGVSEF